MEERVFDKTALPHPPMTGSPYVPPNPEVELLVLLARTRAAPRTDTRVLRLVGDVDWPVLYWLAVRHHVIPAVYTNLQRVAQVGVDVPGLDAFRAQALTESSQALVLAHELQRLSDVFTSHGTGVLAFKGPTLAQRAYGAVAARSCGDLDLLVRAEEFPAAEELLLAHGYSPRVSLTPRQQALFLRLEGGFQYVHQATGANVDLHGRLAARRYSFAPSFDELWTRSEAVQLRIRTGGSAVRAPSAADLVQILSWHGAKHDWFLLRFVCDLAELLESAPELDWDAVVERARQLGAEGVLGLGLRLAREVGGAPVPAEVVRDVAATQEVRSLAAAAAADLFSQRSRGYARHHAFQLRLRGSTAAKARYAASVLTFNKLSRSVLFRT